MKEKLMFLLVYFNKILNDPPAERVVQIRRVVADVNELKRMILSS